MAYQQITLKTVALCFIVILSLIIDVQVLQQSDKIVFFYTDNMSVLLLPRINKLRKTPQFPQTSLMLIIMAEIVFF